MALRNPTTIAALLSSLLLFHTLNLASAASGGHAGGGSFPSGGGSGKRGGRGSSSGGSGWGPHNYPADHHHHHHHHRHHHHHGGGYGGLIFMLILFSVFGGYSLYCHCVGVGKKSVIKLQVGLVGKAQSLQRELNRLTVNTNMSRPTGLRHLLIGTTTSLLRNIDYCISSYSSVSRKSEMEEAEQCFRWHSMEEVAKFDRVTLRNVNNYIVHSTSQSSQEVVHKEYIVVTILVAALEYHKLPTINGTGDLKKALQILASIPSSKILAVEVLWTPQQENDTLTERELLKGYPELRGFFEEGSAEEGPYDDSSPFLGATVVKS